MVGKRKRQTEPRESFVPSKAEADFLASYMRRTQQRPAAPKAKVEHGPGQAVGVSPDHPEEALWSALFAATMGTVDSRFASKLLGELLDATCTEGPTRPLQADDVNTALAAMHGIAPRGRRNGNYKHGRYTIEAMAERRAMAALLRRARDLLGRMR